MGSSLSAGLAGLRASQEYIDVVGNNIANSNTPGYRQQRASFSELLAQTIRPATGPGNNLGGTNPIQVGLGVKIGNVITDTSQGGLISTGRALDLAIEGQGFFVLTDGITKYYTRVGSFGFDANEDLVDSRTGLKVLSPSGSQIHIDSNQIVGAKPTSTVAFSGNVPAEVGGPKTQVITTAAALKSGGVAAVGTTDLNNLDDNTVDYVNGDTFTVAGTDATGTVVNATFTYGVTGTTVADLVTFINTKFPGGTAVLGTDGNIAYTDTAAGVSKVSIQITNDPKTLWAAHTFGVTTPGKDSDTAMSSIEVFDQAGIGHNISLKFNRELDGTWTLKASMPAADGTIPTDTISKIQFGSDGSFSGVFGSGSQLTFQFTGQSQPQNVNVNLGTVGSTSGITQFGSNTSIQAKSQDGYTAGSLTTVNFNSNGELIGFFSNGIQKSLSQVGLANFANQDGLARTGDTNYGETPNSGVAVLGTAQSGGLGVIRPGALESSNVDIAREFVNLIEAQRGFQANARVISATDSLLAELVNIIR
ncbi:MAG: flagellar hook-basal body complex protein [Planctomycetes bacterium]|nr:flagellar hook-basal body complex protein [Planctomycetota bacterium]